MHGLDQSRPVLRRVRTGRTAMPVGAGNLLWSRAHVDDVATAVLAAIDTRAADGLAVNVGETATATMRAWVEQSIPATSADLELVSVPDAVLPRDLSLLRARAQHLLVDVHRGRHLLGWAPGDPAQQVAASVRWHLAHPPATGWGAADSTGDDTAPAAADSGARAGSTR